MSRASVEKVIFSLVKTSFFSFQFRALVDLEDAEDVGRGRGVAHRVEPEG